MAARGSSGDRLEKIIYTHAGKIAEKSDKLHEGAVYVFTSVGKGLGGLGTFCCRLHNYVHTVQCVLFLFTLRTTDAIFIGFSSTFSCKLCRKKVDDIMYSNVSFC